MMGDSDKRRRAAETGRGNGKGAEMHWWKLRRGTGRVSRTEDIVSFIPEGKCNSKS